jgi:spoIIIJ-associated protein
MDSDAKSVETSGKTADEAIREALNRLNASIDDVEIAILDEGAKGFLGVRARPARVRVELKADAAAREPRPARGRPDEGRRQDRQPRGEGRGADDRPRGRGRDDRPRGGRGGRGGDRDRDAPPIDQLPPKLSEAHFLPRQPEGREGAPREDRPRDAGPSRQRQDRDGGRRESQGRRPRRDEEATAGSSEEREPRRRTRPRETEHVPPNIDAEEVNMACELIDDMLRILDIDAEISIREPETPGEGLGSSLAVIDLDGPNMGLIIGRGGETLTALQYLVNLIVSRRHPGQGAPIHLDAANYRRRREHELIDLAQRMAERVRESGRPIRLEPMTAAERRIIHVILAEDPDVETMSTGTGESRKVEIRPIGSE